MKSLMRIHYGEFIVDSKKIFQLTELTNYHMNLFKSLNINEPRQFLGIQDTENS